MKNTYKHTQLSVFLVITAKSCVDNSTQQKKENSTGLDSETDWAHFNP